MSSVGTSKKPDPTADRDRALDRVREALRDLAFGQITITVHDGVVVQVERTERVRVPLR